MRQLFRSALTGALYLATVLSGILLGSDTMRAQTSAADDYEPDTIELDELTVNAPMKDIEFAGDTTVINVGAFRTSRGARLDELVAKVPGMRYDRRTGSLYYNGRQLSEVNINGRKLELGSVASILESLPVEIFDKLKVYDKLSDEELFRGIPSPGREKNMVLDLSTLPEFSSMYMSELKAARGTEHKRDYMAD
ncbi:MAG: hypothetical protein K2K72_08260, partial [Duncaniella sp.]|nr:hypothetical protein [Duncaniella sp.]